MKQSIKIIIVKIKNKVKEYPELRSKLISLLNYFPNIKILIKGLTSKSLDYSSLKPSATKKELLVDVSDVHKEDLKTGIQRVVRSILYYLELQTILDLDVQPVYLTDEDGYWCYKYVKSPKIIVVPKKGDIFLGLDLNKDIHAIGKNSLLKDYKARGLEMVFVVYDILPIQYPQFCREDATILHTLWLDTILKYSSKLICISKAVSDDVAQYIEAHKDEFSTTPTVECFHLGADIENSQPTKGIPSDADELLQKLSTTSSFLMVGTIEPRKGHKQTLEAFERLWSDDKDVALVIVGKKGWMMDDFAKKLKKHPKLNKKLFYLDGISDEYLDMIYKSCSCLLVASEAEGFGLPLIEAAQYKKPIIARDITVFREVAGKFAYYFNNTNSPLEIEQTIDTWLELYKEDKHPKSNNMPWLTWKESTMQLIQKGIL